MTDNEHDDVRPNDDAAVDAEPLPTLSLVVDLDYGPVVNFAMQQNDVDVVRQLRITNVGEVDLAGLDVTFTIENDLADPISQRVDRLAPDSTYNFSSLSPSLDPAKLAGQAERAATRLQLTVTVAGHEPFEKHWPLDVLAFNEWPGLSVIPEIIGAFVLPNDPFVLDLVARSRDHLGRQTGDPTMSGYQAKNPRRVFDVVRAIYETLRDDDITYLGAPPSFEDEGQKVRFPERIFEHRQANCLDATCLLAAAIEAAGIHPLVLLTDSHAFVGFWTIDDGFANPATSDAARIIKLSELGRIVLVEATAITAASHDVSFEAAIRQAMRHMDKPRDFRCALDLAATRKLRIDPLQVGSRGVAIPHEARKTSSNLLPFSLDSLEPPQNVTRGDVADSEETKRARTRIDVWKNKLLDLTLRNRFLNFRTSNKAVDLMIPDLEIFEDALARGSKLFLHPRPAITDDDVRNFEGHEARTGEDAIRSFLTDSLNDRIIHVDGTEDAVAKALTTIYRAAKNDLEETGSNTLYVAVGFLEWYETETSETARRSPIILIPAELVRSRVGGTFSIVASGAEIRVNTTLIEKLKHDYRIDVDGLDQLFEDRNEDGAGIDVRAVLDNYRRAVMNQSRWLIKDTAALAILAFGKATMWEDLERNADVLLENPVIEHLVERPEHTFDDEPLPHPENMDEGFAPSDALCPMDADSSQLAAVAASRNGRTFVLQGPPGTGKSQTITNMIAQAIGDGKRVLFVAEKRAALEVVYSRLERVGLESFCLEVHSNKVKKREVIAELEAAEKHAARREPTDWTTEANRLESLRTDLNRYARAIHEVGPSGYSVFRATSELIGLRDEVSLAIRRDVVTDSSDEKLRELDDLADRLATAADAVGPLREHPLRACRRADWTPRLAGEMTTASETLVRTTNDLDNAWRSVAEKLDASDSPAPTRRLVATVLESLDQAARSLGPPRELIVTPDWEAFERDVADVFEVKRRRDDLRTDLRREYREAFFDLDPLVEIAAIDEAENAWFVVSWFKCRAVRKKFAVYRTGGTPKDTTALRAAFDKLAEIRRLDRDLAHPRHIAPALLGLHWEGGEGEIERAEQVVAWTRTFRAALRDIRDQAENDAVGDAMRDRLVTLATDDRERLAVGASLYDAFVTLRDRHDSASTSKAALASLLDLDESVAWGDDADSGFDVVRKAAEQLIPQIPAISDWCHWRATRDQAVTRGLESIVDAAERDEIAPDHIRRTSRRAVLEEWLTQAIDGDELLRRFNSNEHERKIAEFSRIDDTLIKLAGRVVAARAAQRVPQFSSKASDTSEVGILRREMRKKRAHMPLRKLFRSLPDLLPRLKPCLLMSPLSVAQYLDPKHFHADVVIFDEASQIPVWDAIGALARGAGAVVVGDSKQLPPTSFFSKSTDSDEDDEASDLAVQEVESILDECVASNFPTSRLLWHYRSRHEDLIAFSNHHYYDNRLLTFPAAVGTADDLGVSLRYLADGVYDRGKSATNRREAEAIVAEVVTRCLASGDPESKSSIGVVAFSAAQQRLIEDLLDAARLEHPEIEDYFGDAVPESVFVKNLENVQGDERDIILFSICYGPDVAGKVRMAFGPINNAGGERRLNVAITRARCQVIVFSSIRHDQIDLARTSSVGVRHLKTFLDYADRGPRAIAEASTARIEADFDSPFERDVAEALRARGHAVDVQVGCSGYRIDLAVRHPKYPGRHVLGVECDGATYHSAASARDRDRLRQSVLEGLGWTIHRVWSSDWWRRPEREVEAIEKAIENAVALTDCAIEQTADERPAAKAEATSTVSSDSVTASGFAGIGAVDGFDAGGSARRVAVADVDDTDAVIDTIEIEDTDVDPIALATLETTASEQQVSTRRRPYPILVDPPILGTSGAFYERREQKKIRRRLETIVAEEAPVRKERAYRRLAVSWRLSMLTKRFVDHVDQLLAASDLHLDGDFLWTSDIESADYDIFRIHDAADSPREVEDLPVEEIASATLEVLSYSVALPREELERSVAREFGISRLGKNVKTRMAAGIDHLIAKDVVRDDAGTVRMNG